MDIRRILFALTMAIAMLAVGATAQDDMSGEAGVSVAENDQYGEFLTDNEGNALYVFVDTEMAPDDEGPMTEGVRDNVVECTGGCLEAWPPFTAEGEISIDADGVDGTSLYTTMIGENNQVVFNGYPLYTFANDAEPGDTNGQGIEGGNGIWYLIAPDGTPIDAGEMTQEAG